MSKDLFKNLGLSNLSNIMGSATSAMSSGTDRQPSFSSSSCGDYIIKIDDLVSSSIEDYPDHCPLYAYEEEISRDFNPLASGQLQGSGSVQLSHINIIVPTGVFVADIINSIYAGDHIEEISIKRLLLVKGELQIAEEMTYTGCFFTHWKPNGDKTKFLFRYLERSHEINEIAQDGSVGGQGVSGFNVETMASA